MVNYPTILVASIVGYVIPMLWYSPMLFGKQWLKLSKVKEMKPSPGVMLAGFIATILFNYVFALVIGYAGVADFLSGAMIGVILWFGFVATITLNAVLYEKMPMQLYWINAFQYLVSMIIVGGILAVWQ